jgi:hypothetical protein
MQFSKEPYDPIGQLSAGGTHEVQLAAVMVPEGQFDGVTVPAGQS